MPKISLHSNGLYYTTLSIKGKKHFIYGTTPDEVDTKYTEMKYQNNQGYNINDNPKMVEYMVRWYNAFKKGKGALKTQEMYRNCINVHINPVLGNYKVKEIGVTQVQGLISDITSSKSLAHKVRVTLNQIFKAAIMDRLITFNPVLGCEIIAPDNPKRAFLSAEQRELMLEILKGHRAYPLIFTLLYSGMRMGEALALMWSDIDFKNNIIKVQKALEFDKSKPLNKDPKTERGFREIPISDELLQFLKERKRKTKGKKSLYVFYGHAGGLMGQTEIKRIWRKAAKKIDDWFKANDLKSKGEKKNIEKFTLTFRLLRHTFCTALYDAGIDEVSAAEIMGHDVKIMREIYTHISEGRKKKTRVKLQNLYKVDEKNEQKL